MSSFTLHSSRFRHASASLFIATFAYFAYLIRVLFWDDLLISLHSHPSLQHISCDSNTWALQLYQLYHCICHHRLSSLGAHIHHRYWSRLDLTSRGTISLTLCGNKYIYSTWMSRQPCELVLPRSGLVQSELSTQGQLNFSSSHWCGPVQLDYWSCSCSMCEANGKVYATLLVYSGSKNCPNVWLFFKDWSRTNQEN